MSPIYVPGKLTLRQTYIGTDDTDAAAYIAAVEAADEIASPGVGGLETATKVAIHSFVKGCKNDGIWDAIKASCILAGARTLAGALVPLVGDAPTNVGGNFVTGDYDRKTGLKGDGSTKSLDSNRLCSSDAIDNHHQSVFIATINTVNTAFSHNYIGAVAASNVRGLVTLSSTGQHAVVSNGTTVEAFESTPPVAGFFGYRRNNNSNFNARLENENFSSSNVGVADISNSVFVFQRGDGRHINGRISFYSIGESLDLALLDTRVSALITAIGAAIP
jgi:hypothetical protein